MAEGEGEGDPPPAYNPDLGSTDANPPGQYAPQVAQPPSYNPAVGSTDGNQYAPQPVATMPMQVQAIQPQVPQQQVRYVQMQPNQAIRLIQIMSRATCSIHSTTSRRTTCASHLCSTTNATSTSSAACAYGTETNQNTRIWFAFSHCMVQYMSQKRFNKGYIKKRLLDVVLLLRHRNMCLVYGWIKRQLSLLSPL
eukprot:241896_1